MRNSQRRFDVLEEEFLLPWVPRFSLLLCVLLVPAFGCSSDPDSAEMEDSDFEEVPLTEADLGKTQEARSYLRDPNSSVWTEDFTVSELEQIIADLYTAGASEVLFADIDDFDGKNLSAWLVIRLPADPAARGLVFAKYNEVYGQHAYDSPVEDTGQSFLDIALD